MQVRDLIVAEWYGVNTSIAGLVQMVLFCVQALTDLRANLSGALMMAVGMCLMHETSVT